MARKRFNRVAICCSDIYLASKRAHKRYINEYHSANIEVLNKITIRQKYISVFGKLIPVTETEIKIHNTLTVI